LHVPSEPTGFGKNAAVLWALLQGIDGWDCVNVTSTCAPALGALIQTQTGTPVHYYGDIYHILQQPVLPFDHPAARQLTLKDLSLLEVAPPDVRGSGFGSTHALLVEGIVAAAIIENRVVAIAHTSALSQQHADIGVSTLAEWRGHGFASATASIVAHAVQKAGQIPVWSTGESNYASLRVAQKLGFTKVAERTYIIVDSKR
jgi:GNAT superfamily N-acetyltransferase